MRYSKAGDASCLAETLTEGVLPLAKLEQMRYNKSNNVSREAFCLERKLKILITDDSQLLRKKLRAELEGLGCEVIEAENGKEAVMKDLQEKPDGIFLDIVMPEVGGIEALQAIREVNPEMPVIMLSSAGTPQKLMETLKMGALDFIQKPYTSEQIKKALAAIRKKAE